MIESKIQKALKPIEKVMVDQQNQAIKHNRNMLVAQIKEMNDCLDKLVEEKVRKALKKNDE